MQLLASIVEQDIAQPAGQTPPETRVSEIMSTNVLTIEPHSNLPLALQVMLWGRCRHLPVVGEDGSVLGVITEHDLHRGLAHQRLAQATVAEVMNREVVFVSPDATISEVAQLMSKAQTTSVPVMKDGRLEGIVTSTDVLTLVARGSKVAPRDGKLVADIMCAAPRSVLSGRTLGEAVAEMINADVRHLPVVDETNRVVGILSDRDLRALVGDPVAVLRDETFDETMALEVDEVMTLSPIMVRNDQPIDALSSAMLDERVGAVPVVDHDDRLVGIISYIDVLRVALRKTE